MKTIEEKAKRYDEAYKVAESIHRFSSNPAEIKRMEEIFPSLKEYEGERIRNVLIGWINLESSISFGDTFDGFSKEQILAWLENQGEHNPADKAEPKFKVSDYVVDNCGYIWRIEGIINKFYILEGIDGGESRPTIEWVNKTFHLWDITKDAKDGDVLVASDGSVFLFAGVVDCACKYYAALATDDYVKINKEAKGGYWETSRAVYPATKEQRDKLEKAMADAGYVFDFEKKELKEIEDEEYNDEDYGIDGLWHAKNILEKTLGKVEGYQTDDGILDHKCAITAVDKLYKQKPAGWSEEDEHWRQKVIDFMNHPDFIKTIPTLAKDTINCIKSLKDRYAWKPAMSK